ncbi:tetratricopeptide repeat protein [bacterium]|nr:tetratricopeptide repeat protein [bacterium]
MLTKKHFATATCLALACTLLVAAKPKGKAAKAKAKATSSGAPGPYQNFELPRSASAGPGGGAGKFFLSDRLVLKNAVREKTSSIDSKKFLFAKEAFLAEKREEAIKLLRQQMDSGLNVNKENMLLRLGQLYAEKYMELSYQETEVYTAKLQDYESAKAAGDKKAKAPKLDSGRSKGYLKDALKHFYSLEKNFPKHPKMDEVVFFIGFVEMESGNGAKGASYLERVVKNYPKSRKFEEAVVYLGDYYFDKSKFKDAASHFAILVKNPESSMHHYAVYKTAWCDLNTQHAEKGLREMKKLVKDLQGASEQAKFNLREQALRDLVIFYADAGSPDDAVDFFEDTVGHEKAMQNLRLIADSLRNKARDADAIKAYTRLMKDDPNGPEAPMIQLGIYESLNRLEKTGQAVDALRLALDTYGPNSDWASSYKGTKEELAEIEKGLEEAGSKAAFFYHASAQKGSNKALYGYALTLYDALLKDFPQHPDRKKFFFYRAEVQYGQKKWLEAADSYMEASRIAPKDKLTDEAVYNALLALDQLTAKVEQITRYSEEEQKKIDLREKDIPEGETRFIEIAEYYIKEYPKGDRIVDVRFRIAAIYYRYHHFDKALPLFEKIALEHPRHRSAGTAAHIVLDVLNMQKKYDKLDAQAKLFASTKGLGDDRFRQEMKEISGQISFKLVEQLEAREKWNEAAEAYLAVVKANVSADLTEKAFYNALVSYEKANEPGKAQELTKQFVKKYPKSKYAEQLMLTMAKNAEKLYDFDDAEKLYHEFAVNHPSSKEARKALYNSAVFAELSEKNAQATERYQSYLKGGNVPAEEQRSIQVSLAKIARKQGNWDGFLKIYRQMIRDAATAEQKLTLWGEATYQLEVAGKDDLKQQAVREMKALYGSVGKNAKNLGLAPKYLAEAQFKSIAGQRKKYDETVIRFPVQDLVYLVGMKQRRLKNLGQAYDEVIEVGVPEWGVAALHDKAEAFAAYGENFRKLQIPAKMQGDERTETELGLKKIEADVVVPLDKQATDIFKLCASKAAEFHVANTYASKCRARVKSEALIEPSGVVPQVGYWSLRSIGDGVAYR